jgi:hypothetical protein
MAGAMFRGAASGLLVHPDRPRRGGWKSVRFSV